jgi:hypothetical protein
MFKTLKIMIIFITFPAISIAGVGTIVGGDKIVFQQDSLHISSIYNSSLCYDRGNYYATVKNHCYKWASAGEDARVCVEKGILNTVQPRESMRERCVKMESDECVKTKYVPFIQKRTRTIRYIQNDSEYTKKFKVQNCYK